MDNTIVDWDCEFIRRWERLPVAQPGDADLVRGRQHFEMEVLSNPSPHPLDLPLQPSHTHKRSSPSGPHLFPTLILFPNANLISLAFLDLVLEVLAAATQLRI